MPTYNGERFVASALQNIVEQRAEGIEVVVVDDGSTDRTSDIVSEFARTLRVRLITRGRIGNWVAATNLGLREAEGEWACFLHQDDFWLPGRIARLRRELQDAKGTLVLHNALFVGPNDEVLGPWTCPLHEGDVPPCHLIERLLIQNFIAICSPLFLRRAALESGGLDEALWFAADWDLWLRLGSTGPVRFVSETLSAFRVHPRSQTAARQLMPGEWDRQLGTVLARHLPRLSGAPQHSRFVKRVAMVSIAVNSALSRASRNEAVRPWAALAGLFALGPSGWHKYFRDSRIAQRVVSRLKVQWQGSSNRTFRSQTAGVRLGNG